MLHIEGKNILDAAGNRIELHGINMVCKDRKCNHIGAYKTEDFQYLRGLGMNVIRLGIFWESVEPKPGVYDEAYLDAVEQIVNCAGEQGLYVFLDMHQDLFGAELEDGAPAWATLTDGLEHIRTELWSDSYLLSPAVQRAFDNFWSNKAAEDGVGIREHFVKMWVHIAKRFATNPYVIGYDFFNEPFPGSVAMLVVELLACVKDKILGGQATEEMIMGIIQEIEPITGAFEEDRLNPFYREIGNAVRAVDPDCILFLENNYFSNAGIPSHVQPVTDAEGRQLPNQIYAPHGYDIFVDTEDYDNDDTSRVDLIFATHQAVAEAINLPVLVGEWGCYPSATERQVAQAKHLKAFFAQMGAGDTYFDFSHLYGNRIQEALRTDSTTVR